MSATPLWPSAYPDRRPLWVAATATAVPLAILGLGLIHPDLLVASTIVLIIGVAKGWGALLESPTRGRAALVVALTGALCLTAVRIVTDLSAVTLVLGFTLIISFIAEMTRGAHRPQATWSLATMVSGSVVAAAGAVWALFGFYPVMHLLAISALPATGLASLTLALPARHPWQRVLYAVLAAAGISALITQFYLKNFPDLALAVPLASINPSAAVWVMTVGVGVLAGFTVSCTDVLFPIRRAPGYHWQQLTLALLPSLFLAMPIYALARLITG